MTSYHLDAASTDLAALGERLETTDLIPSQMPLLDGLGDALAALEAGGVHTLADLRAALKSPKGQAALAAETGIDPAYLRLLRRTVDGFFPKPRPLKDWDWLPDPVIDGLKAAGITNTRQLFEAASEGTETIARAMGVDVAALADAVAIADLCRIQWVSPNYARALAAAGVPTPARVAAADPDTLCAALEKANAGARFYNGKVGRRDVGRLVAAAAYVP